MATVVLEEGFDPIDAGWTLATLGSTVSRRTGRTGQALCFETSAGTGSYIIPAAAESDTLTVGFAFRIEAMTGNRPVISLRSDAGATIHLTLMVLSTGGFEVRRGSATGTIIATSAATGLIAVDTWAYIELRARLHDTAGTVVVRVDGTERINASALDTRNAGTKTTFDAIFLTAGSTVYNVYDDLYLVTGTDSAFRGDQTYEGTGPFDIAHDGFQSDLGGWTPILPASPPTIAPGRNGNGITCSSASVGLRHSIVPAERFVVVGFALRISASPTSPSDVVLLRAADADALASLRLATDRSLSANGSFAFTAAGVVPLATWCYVEWSFLFNYPNGTAAAAAIRVNDTQVGYQRDIILSPGDDTAIALVDVRGVTGTTTQIDDLYVLSGTLADFEGDQIIGPGVPQLSYYDGSAFVAGPVRAYDGSSFLDTVALKIWNGSEFV